MDLDESFSPESQDTPLCFELLITDDNIVEASEVVFISLSSADSAVVVSSDGQQLNITIEDNDGKTTFPIHVHSGTKKSRQLG